jgi:hypothetical protein
VIGCVVGEILRRCVGGVWVDDPYAPGVPLRATVQCGIERVMPARWVYERLRDGGAQRIEPRFAALRAKLRRPPAPEEAAGWLAQGRAMERVGELDLAVSFYRDGLALGPAEPLHGELVAQLATAELALSMR